jgi:hypothetical protein
MNMDVEKQIKEHGFGVTSVFPTKDEPGHWFHYTVGNHGVGLPELLAIGGDQRMGPVLRGLAEIMRERKAAFTDGELVDLGGKYPVKVINVSCQDIYDRYTLGAGSHYGADNYLVQLMMIPDRNGKFPDDPNCAEPYASARVCSPSGMAIPWAQLAGLSSN